jgi:hypothetical protein
MHPDWLGGGGTVAPELPRTQSAPILSVPKPASVPAPTVPLTQSLGKLLHLAWMEEVFKGLLFDGDWKLSCGRYTSLSFVSKKVKDPTANEAVNPMKTKHWKQYKNKQTNKSLLGLPLNRTEENVEVKSKFVLHF